MINGRYPLFRARNLRTINRVILEDQFDDAAKANWVGCVFADDYLAFLQRNLLEPYVLDVGCGSGCSFQLLPITAAVDGNPTRANAARNFAAKLGRSVDVREAAAECLPFEPASFTTVLHLHGFAQTRSDYEAIMEANRVLALGGHYIFDLFHVSRYDVEFGRVIEPRSYIRIMRDFGFELIERRTIDEWDEGLAFEKVEDFNYKRMHKLQLIETKTGLFKVRNLDNENYHIR